ncbi:MAG: hypothetical protein WCC80_01130, partial [Pseudolabrys sp.]
MPLPVTRKLTLRGLGSINANAVCRAQLAQRWRVFLRALVIWQAAKYPKTGLAGCWLGLGQSYPQDLSVGVAGVPYRASAAAQPVTSAEAAQSRARPSP